MDDATLNWACPHGHPAAECRRGQNGVAYCRACKRENTRNWREHQSEEQKAGTRAYMRDYQRARGRKLRAEVLAAYGGACTCCGEATPEFLSVDHINNDGAAHRKVIGEGSVRFYSWLKRNGWPREDFQLLCWNCHMAKSHYKVCPHAGR